MQSTFLKNISITGHLGSGKSTLTKLLCEKIRKELAVDFVAFSTGNIQREVAKKYNMSILELNEYARAHPEVDYEVDNMIKNLSEKKERFIIDSRLAWHFLPQSFKVYLSIRPKLASLRIWNDARRKNEKYSSIESSLEALQARRKSECERFKVLYGIDIENLENYDCIVEVDEKTPATVCEIVFEAYKYTLSFNRTANNAAQN